MEKLYLVYINNTGKDWKGNNIYEFLFSDKKENIEGDDWDAIPASGRCPTRPAQGQAARRPPKRCPRFFSFP